MGLGTLLLVFLVGMRRKSPLVMGAVVSLARNVVNPRTLRSAGDAGAINSKVRHRGRTSGRAYETPVTAIRDGDMFIIALPYGTTANWMKNVLAAGEATIVHDGETVAVDSPELLPMHDVEDVFAPGEQRSHRIFNVDHALRLQRATTTTDDFESIEPSVAFMSAA